MNIKLLNKESQALHKELTSILGEAGILTLKDKLALELLVTTYDNYNYATEQLLENGRTISITNSSGETVDRPSPYVKQQLDSQIQLSKLLSEFYLTPKSRNKLAENEKEESTPFEKIIGVIEKRANEKTG